MSNSENHCLDNFFDNGSFNAAYNKNDWHRSIESFLEYFTRLFYEYAEVFNHQWAISLPGESAKYALFNDMLKRSEGNARRIGEGIIKALTHCLQGYRNRGYNVFSDCLPRFERFAPIIDESSNKDHYFRVRKDDPAKLISTVNEMFHMPFDRRHEVGEYRYSIHGFPCLYLASSVYTCWEELEVSSPNTVVLSRYKPTASYDRSKILLLNIAPLQVKEEIERRIRLATHDNTPCEMEGIRQFFEFWPLQLACSIPTKYPKAIFHEEYIIPQFLMEWIRDRGFHMNVNGVCYRTTKVPQMSREKMFPGLLYNYAFPARRADSNYCSELSSDFHLTPPIPFELSHDDDRCKPKHCGGVVDTDSEVDFGLAGVPFTGADGVLVLYHNTEFFKAEHRSTFVHAVPLKHF